MHDPGRDAADSGAGDIRGAGPGGAVPEGWWSTDGTWSAVEPERRAALSAAVGDPSAEDPPCWFVPAGTEPEIWSPSTVELDDDGTVEVRHRLPGDLPVGCHRLRSHDGHLTHLFVVPDAAAALPRGWGWAAQVYSLRSGGDGDPGDWGVGDLRDLAELSRRAGRAGAAVVAHNPLGAPLPPPPGEPPEPSPYYAATRRVGSPMHLRIPEVPGAELVGDDLAAAAAAGAALQRGDVVDHGAVWDLKVSALRAIWVALGQRPTVTAAPGVPPDAAFDAAVQAHARACALAVVHRGGLSRWPAALADPSAPAAHDALVPLAEEVAFWRWVSLEVDRQHAGAARAGARLMGDLAVGFSPEGSEAWQHHGLLAEGWRIGAPPDDFATDGQEWGLPPLLPWRLRAVGYRPWIDTLRCAMRHAAVLRIDHVMGLFRVFWVPEGGEPADGGYVHFPAGEMLDVAVIEAHRRGVALVGEDLGTVDPSVREQMAARRVAGYRVAWFESEPPPRWTAGSVAMLSTHDLPTVAGVWSGLDGTPELRDRLGAFAGCGDGASELEVAGAAHRALGTAGSDLVLASLEDALGVPERPNVPGSPPDTPNWSHRLAVPVDELRLESPFGPAR